MKITFATSGISLLTSYLILINIATEVKGYLENEWVEENLPTDKRYAMLSYSYSGRNNKGRNNYNSGRSYNSYSDYYAKRFRSKWKPWLNLPDTRCYRDRCTTNRDCCMRFNICDSHLKVCLDCWYGARCESSADCCQRFPYCNKRYKYCTN